MYIVFFLFMFILPYIVKEVIYRQTTYYKSTHNPYFKIVFDKGLYGEYLTYMDLRPFEKQGARFVFNCYLPRENGTTTEIDVIMIWNSGIYVFESKNYSGWIFGREDRKVWTQCLPRGKGRSAMKAKFFNPIMQNKLHLRCLKDVLMDGCPEIHSIVVFSNRCTLKDVRTHSGYKEISVIYRNQVRDAVELINRETPEMTPDALCEEIYSVLYKYSQVTKDVKAAHIQAINAQFNSIKADETVTTSDLPQNLQPSVTSNSDIKMPAPTVKTAPDTPLSGIIKKCPRCSSPLVLRTAKKGPNAGQEFYGCSNFPKCRYTKKV